MSIADEVRIGAFVFTSRYDGQSAGEVLARGVATAQAAEDAGFDDVWVTEHHFVPFGVNPSALTFAGYLLGRTSTVRVGTAVTVLPLHSPVHVAEQAALLDHLSGGRFDLGVGRAQPVVDYEVIGRGVEYWQRGLPEALDLTLAALSGPVVADSELYRFREVVPEPGPAPGRSTPVYLAANSPASVELAARRGLPMLLFFDRDPEAKAASVAEHADIARAAGHPDTGYAHGAALFTHVADDPGEARRVMRRAAGEFVRASQNYRLLLDVPQRVSGDVPPEHVIDGLTDSALATHPVGPPDVCVDRLVNQIRVSGCRRILCQVEISGDHDSVLANVKRLGEEVLPEVRRRLRG
ncbi:alkanesulfonate monooxygenase SsuD/methylene tetrahydromethanopterin reductase-like flavin-dependent oxidoreductase (luciferase family) [Nocardia transvalensis]|uniref:Alkanesulfonate monooxygenase SsuD/methylene tetrahydromethanopterin reductase-like flavin-dependent oxidoreductase (Luciferase family) n=1 Tax=Nocardia transvalensis TaxID=37333 RepID=A0A7W9UKV9_9NOCA|nr:LLM class flavin-dependent oxidoreductase [Nocardia transvalensis]MBB5916924.1 alkanesulfonate monooxygenase SsuD/methylene tetrahydromethanopterin reductase-like flavin-dependent oxidoreductase (luciferase family) [Nocardia transvalensis]